MKPQAFKKAIFCSLLLAVYPGLASSGPKFMSSQETESKQGSPVRMNTLSGPTGLLTVPTAYVTPHTQVQFSTCFGREVRSVAANYGLTPGVEVGGTFLDRENADNKGVANAKVNIIPKNFEWFEIGVGVIDGGDAIERTFFVVASANFPMQDKQGGHISGVRLHVGTGTGAFNEKLIGGAEIVLNEQFSLVGEWDTENFNAALRYVHDNTFRLQIGFQNNQIFFGATYGLKF